MDIPIVLARGTGDELLKRQDDLERRERWMPEGSLMELVLHSSDAYRSILAAAAAGINGAAELAGSQARAEVDPDQPVLRIRWRKGQPWVRVVLRVLVPFLIGVAVGLLIASWRFIGHVAITLALAVLAALALGVFIPELISRSRASQEEAG